MKEIFAFLIVLLLLQVASANEAADLNIPAGENQFNVADAGLEVQLPPDFFGPGSEPFEGTITCGGDGDGFPDTILERQADIILPPPPSHNNIPIELTELNLVSCQPIVVNINDGSQQQWDVRVGLSEIPSLGDMTIFRIDENGGTFDSQLFVQPLFIFTQHGDGELIDNPDDPDVIDNPELINPIESGPIREVVLEIIPGPFNLEAVDVTWGTREGNYKVFTVGPILYNAENGWMNLVPLPPALEEPEVLCCIGAGPNDNCLRTSPSQCREHGGAIMDCGLPEDIVVEPVTVQDCNEQRRGAFEECRNFNGIPRAVCMGRAILESRECTENVRDAVPTELRNFTITRANATDPVLANLTRDVISTGVNNSAYVNGTYDCRSFAHALERNLTALGYDATWTVYWCYGGVGNPPAAAHAVTDIHLADGRTVFIEPQTNQIINLDFDGDGVVEVNNNGYVPGQNRGQTDDNCKISVFGDRAAAAAAGVPGA